MSGRSQPGDAVASLGRRAGRLAIVCFFVDREARGRGLSNRMLRAAMDYARSSGARLIEAYPVDRDERSHPDDMFFGARSMFDRAGFREVAVGNPTGR